MLKEMHHTALSVTDMERSLGLYRDILGMEVEFDVTIKDIPAFGAIIGLPSVEERIVMLRLANCRIELFQFYEPRGRKIERRQCDTGFMHVAFVVDELDEICRKLKGRGVEFYSGAEDLGPYRVIFFKGFDGETIELMLPVADMAEATDEGANLDDRKGKMDKDQPKKIRKLKIFFDGASRGNPGPAAIGVVLSGASGKVVRELSESIGKTTNNFAEYTALIRALEEAKKLGADVAECFSDSELVVKQMTGVYRIKSEALLPLARKAMSLSSQFDDFSIRHVPRSKNRLADKLASEALDKKPGNL